MKKKPYISVERSQFAEGQYEVECDACGVLHNKLWTVCYGPGFQVCHKCLKKLSIKIVKAL